MYIHQNLNADSRGFLKYIPIVISLSLLSTEVFAQQVEPRSIVLQESASGSMQPIDEQNSSQQTKQYWLDINTDALMHSASDGSNASIAIDSLNDPYGIAFDSDLQELVWTSSGDEVVEKSSLINPAKRVLQTSFEEPFVIETQQETGRATYFVDGNSVFRVTSPDLRAASEGHYIQPEVTQDILLTIPEGESVHGLALDTNHQVLYIGDEFGRMTRRIDLNAITSQRLVYQDIAPKVERIRPPKDPIDPVDPEDPQNPRRIMK